MTIKLGIIGLSAKPSAWATIAHIGPLKAHLSEEYTLTAVGGSSKDTARAAAQAFSLPEEKAYVDAKQLAEDTDVDLVVVAVKVPKHKELVIPALDAGKDVFVEWPLGNGLKEAQELVDRASRKDVRTMVNLQARHAGSILKARDLIQSGALGKILSTTVFGHDSILYRFSESNSYLADVDNGANLVTSAAAHTLDALCFVLGEFEWLSATTKTQYPNCLIDHPDGTTSTIPRTSPDYIALYGCLRSGTNMSFTYYTTPETIPGEVSWTFLGEKGSLKLEGSSCMIQMFPLQLSGSEGQGERFKWVPTETKPPMAFGGVGESYEAFAKGDVTGVVDFREALKRHEMLDAIFRSAETGLRQSY